MDVPQIIATVLGSSVLGVVAKSLFDQWGALRQSKAAERRLEVDRADAAERAVHDRDRDLRILREALHVHRRIIIDAPCMGPADLPQWPETSTIRETP